MTRRTSTSSGRSTAGSKRSAAKTRTVKPRAAKTSGRSRAASRRSSARAPRLPFFGREWVKAAKEAVNHFPSAEARAQKIERFWEWIDQAKEHVNCQLGLAVDGLPGRSRRDCLLLDLEEGRCVRARLSSRDEAEASANYILVGSYQDWQEIMGGFDMGKAVMYRKLLLEKGAVLEFFKSIYYWTESLASIQRIPTEFAAASSRPN